MAPMGALARAIARSCLAALLVVGELAQSTAVSSLARRLRGIAVTFVLGVVAMVGAPNATASAAELDKKRELCGSGNLNRNLSVAELFKAGITGDLNRVEKVVTRTTTNIGGGRNLVATSDRSTGRQVPFPGCWDQ